MLARGSVHHFKQIPAVAGSLWQGPDDVHMDVSEASGWDCDGLYHHRVLPGSLASLTQLAVRDPCGNIAVEATPHYSGGDVPLGGPHAGVSQAMKGGKNGGPVHQRYQPPDPPLLETSQRSSMPPTTRFSTCKEVEGAVRCVSGMYPGGWQGWRSRLLLLSRTRR